jgi:tRNA(Ile)-lysidine synthase
MAKTAADHPAPWPSKVLQPFPPKRRYLIGVSGGRDSVALLHWLVGHGYRRLIVCHLNHRLRGRASTADAKFVERLARDNNLEFETAAVDVEQLATDTKRSIETAARTARFAFYAQIARRRRCRTIFLGHHADDLVETFLINLFRGAGPLGLGSIREVTTQHIGGTELTIVRPLLGVWRKEITAYVGAKRLAFREDASNRSFKPTRNRVRHEIIGMVEKQFGRDVRHSIWRAATIAAEEESWLRTLLPPIATGAAELPVPELREMPVALQRRAIRKWLREQKVADISFDMVEQVRGLLDHENGPAKINLPRDLHVRRRAKKLFIER